MNELTVIQLGRMGYAEALAIQRRHLEEVLAKREAGEPEVGRLLLVEHDPVITVSKRAQTSGNLVASEAELARAGVAVHATDRGGDITYHGPGQLVVYPVLDLNVLGLKLVEYIRLLEDVIIETLASFGIEGQTEAGATGVWVGVEEATESASNPSPVADSKWDGGGAESARRRGSSGGEPTERRTATMGEMGSAKIAAIGVRVRRWVSMHGFALNVRPDLSHFDLIVPCGLEGRAVTSMHELLGDTCPEMPEMKEVVAGVFSRFAADLV